ncbi:hypothetical protein VitviT2T_021776 [Vitis vinifera]|uniref:SNF2 N-terminal domain-containing protein n=1 Tax=Vitis vinifera TaxID=29760 RepID=A0ABY9D9V4_VITVI|nr:hypothetical protein VitviT2T_021776 [Vitis vinifera]
MGAHSSKHTFFSSRDKPSVDYTLGWQEILFYCEEFALQSFKDLSAHDVVVRLMRKENYLIGMLPIRGAAVTDELLVLDPEEAMSLVFIEDFTVHVEGCDLCLDDFDAQLQLLNPLYLRNVAHLEQLLNLLKVIFDDVENKPSDQDDASCKNFLEALQTASIDIAQNNSAGASILEFEETDRDGDTSDNLVTSSNEELQTVHRIITTGASIENKLAELWSLFDFIFPEKLGVLRVFEAEFTVPISIGGYANASPLQVSTIYRCAIVLRDLIMPYLRLQMNTGQNRRDGSNGGEALSSEETVNEHMDRISTRVRSKPESTELPSLEEDGGLNDEYSDPTIGFDGSLNTSEGLCAEQHDNSSTHEIDSLKSMISSDLNGFSYTQSPQTEKGDPSDQSLDHSADNDLAIAYEEKNRLRRSSKIAESSVIELKQERGLDESKAEQESLVRKMDQMEYYYEALVQELEKNQKQMLGELQNL